MRYLKSSKCVTAISIQCLPASFKKKNANPQTDLEEERIKQKIADRTRKEKCRIYFIRFILNIFVIAVLACCFYSIYVATAFSQEAQRNNTKVTPLSLALLLYFSTQVPIRHETHSYNYHSTVTVITKPFFPFLKSL